MKNVNPGYVPRRWMLALGAGLFAMGLWGSAVQASELRLIMVDQPGCAYCQAWDDEIAPAYSKTAEGRFAPLMRADLHDGPPDGVRYARRVAFTPTFILIQDGQEIARMEGYIGEDFFWPVYASFLQDHTDFVPERQ